MGAGHARIRRNEDRDRADGFRFYLLERRPEDLFEALLRVDEVVECAASIEGAEHEPGQPGLRSGQSED